MEGDTVAALGTPPGESGVAVIRISGPGAVAALERLAPGAGRWAAHRLHKTVLRDREGEPLDEVLAAVMRAPRSYTGEDMAEIYCHGGMRVIGDILSELFSLGCREAAPGELTRRAFTNGRIDLAQAEAVADIIAAETTLARRVALEHLEGKLSRAARGLEEGLLEELALVEASIDFPEDDIPVYSPEGGRRAAREMRERIARLIESEKAGGALRRGIRVTILGPRNVGKSSLYNALLGEERAIVSPIPGTTRDLLRERIHIGGFTYCLEDTAGIAETGCEIEARGIEIGREAAGRADVVLFVLDGSAEIPPPALEEAARMDSSRLVCVLNKKDLGLAASAEDAARLTKAPDVVAVSAVTGEGLDILRSVLFERTAKRGAATVERERIAVNARQAAALREADQALARFEGLVDAGGAPELLSVEIRAAADALGAITGRSVAGDLLDAIFSRFCIGK
jgi:tRNA modification GTPase